MKKIFKALIAIVAVTVLLSSCEKETFPLGASATSDQIAESPTALTASVDGLVAQAYQPYFFYGSSNQLEFDISYAGLQITYARMLCDMVNNSATIGYDWWTGYTGSYGYSMKYNQSRQTVPFMTLYKFVKSANDIIGPLCNKEDNNDEAKGYLGTAYVYRALMYHDIYNMYLPVLNPYTDCEAIKDLTAPIIRSSSEEESEYKSARAPKEAMAEQVFADLDKAEELFTSIGYTPKTNRYPSLAVVYGLKARMYMAVKDYANAATYARKAITESGKTPLTEDQWLDPTKAFCDASGNNSWMWYYSISANNMGNLCNPTGFLAGESDWGYNSLTQLALQKWLYDRMNRSDFRKKSFIDPDRKNFPASYYKWGSSEYLEAYPFEDLPDYMSFKIRCKEGDWETYSIGGAVDFPIMRVEEMYLIEAEAVGLSQGENAGIELLEKFMTTYRDPAYTYAAAKATFDQGFVKNFSEEVLYQKRIEFYGEGVGFFDAKRIRPGIITWYPGSNVIHETVKYEIKEASPYWNFLIPQSEIENNDYIVAEGETPVEVEGVMQTVNNPDPTNKVANSTKVF